MKNKDLEQSLLTLRGVKYGFPGLPTFLGPVDISISPGECLAIVGPNGAGKSTLLRLMAGLLAPREGRIEVEGLAIDSLPSRTRARRIAFVPQHPPGDPVQTAGEIVLLGRYPHRGFGLFESAQDHAIARKAMTLTDTLEFSDRPVTTLSGGEMQRVHLAAALAQETDLLLLDEPTAALDIQHQMAIFTILRAQALDGGKAVVVVTHDVNLAAEFCTRVLLLGEGRIAAIGSPEKVITPEVLGAMYGVRMVALVHDEARTGRWVVPMASTSAAAS